MDKRWNSRPRNRPRVRPLSPGERFAPSHSPISLLKFEQIAMPKLFAPLALLLMVTLLVGCGDGSNRPKLVKTSGQVTLNGEPLAAGVDGYIQVLVDGGRPATGKIDAETGRFTLSTFDENDGCVPGTHKVVILVNKLGPGGSPISLVDEKYREAATTDLTVTIDGPTDSLVVDLQGSLKDAKEDPNALKGDDPGF